MLQEHESAVIDISRNIYIFTTTSLSCVAGADLGAGVCQLQDKGILARPRSPLRREPRPQHQQLNMSQALQFMCRIAWWASYSEQVIFQHRQTKYVNAAQSRRGNTSIDTQQPMG